MTRHRRDSRPHRFAPEPDILRRLRSHISEAHPLPLLIEASSLIAATATRPHTPSEPSRELSLERLIESMCRAGTRETSAILYAIVALLPPGQLATLITDELDQRTGHPLPDWVQQIGRIEVVSTSKTVDPLDDGDNIFIMIRWPTGHTATIWPYIDHNMGTIVKDALAAPWDIIEIAEKLDSTGEVLELDFIDPADARATIEKAIATAEARFGQLESHMWPRLRPLLEWTIGHLPQGGLGYERPYWSFEQRTDLLARFGNSTFGRESPVDLAWLNIARMLITFGCDYGTGDPTHWSPVSVEIALDDFFAERLIAPRELREEIPVVLRDFIRFCHEEKGIARDLTEETIEAVARWEHATIEGPTEPPIEQQVIDNLGIHDRFAVRTLASLAEAVGGVDELYELDDSPIPDEPFDWSTVPDHIHDKVAAILELTDRCSDELLDVEYRTILRRILARTAAADPAVFARRRADIIARTLVWIAGHANRLFSGQRLTVKELTAWFGLKGNPTGDQAAAFRAALGVDDPYWDSGLEPSLLHSAHRAWVIKRRNRVTEQIDR